MSQHTDADDWDAHWSDYSDAARLNPAQDFRRRLVLRHLRDLARPRGGPLRLLDIGCGTGDFALAFREAFPGADYLGIDTSAKGVELARRKAPEFAFRQLDLLRPAEVEPAYLGWATAAVCSEVLEHVEAPELILENVVPLLAPGAPLVVTVPGGPMSAYDRHIGHRRHFTGDTLRALLRRSGYDVRGVWGAGFPFFNLYRMTVIARGRKLVDDVAAGSSGRMSRLSRLAMGAFGVLFRFNRHRSSRGWQQVAVAVLPAPGRVGAAREAQPVRPQAVRDQPRPEG